MASQWTILLSFKMSKHLLCLHGAESGPVIYHVLTTFRPLPVLKSCSSPCSRFSYSSVYWVSIETVSKYIYIAYWYSIFNNIQSWHDPRPKTMVFYQVWSAESVFDSLFILFGFHHFIKAIFIPISDYPSFLLSTHPVLQCSRIKSLCYCELCLEGTDWKWKLTSCGLLYALTDPHCSQLIIKSKHDAEFSSHAAAASSFSHWIILDSIWEWCETKKNTLVSLSKQVLFFCLGKIKVKY